MNKIYCALFGMFLASLPLEAKVVVYPRIEDEAVKDDGRYEVYVRSAAEGGEWQSLTIPNYPDGNNWDSVESGDIDLSAYCGQKIQIGFKYTSSSSAAGTWEIQDVVIK